MRSASALPMQQYGGGGSMKTTMQSFGSGSALPMVSSSALPMVSSSALPMTYGGGNAMVRQMDMNYTTQQTFIPQPTNIEYLQDVSYLPIQDVSYMPVQEVPMVYVPPPQPVVAAPQLRSRKPPPPPPEREPSAPEPPKRQRERERASAPSEPREQIITVPVEVLREIEVVSTPPSSPLIDAFSS